jgi:ATP-dependent Clp protease ATP-binding subunit ClpA
MNAMRQQFKPEFLNRVDEFVIFNSLGKQQMRKITALELMKVSERLRDKRITLKATDEALDFLSEVRNTATTYMKAYDACTVYCYLHKRCNCTRCTFIA